MIQAAVLTISDSATAVDSRIVISRHLDGSPKAEAR